MPIEPTTGEWVGPVNLPWRTRALLAESEEERLRVIVDLARAFVEHHQIGQPGTPGTLYPMTYGVQDQWHEEWDRRLAALIKGLA